MIQLAPDDRRSSLRTAGAMAAVIGTVTGFAISLVLLARVIGAASPWLGLLLMFYFLGLAKVAEPLARLRLPRALRAMRGWERSGRLQHALGVVPFGALLRNTPLRHLNRAVYLRAGNADLAGLHELVGSAEAAHFWAAALFMPYIGYVWTNGHGREAAIFMLVQLSFNVYPILHLRLVRFRLERIAGRRRASGPAAA